MIVIELSGSKTASCDGVMVDSRGYMGPIGPLARVLTERGYNPLESVTVGTTVFTGCNLQWWAERDFTEYRDKVCHAVKHREFGGMG